MDLPEKYIYDNGFGRRAYVCLHCNSKHLVEKSKNVLSSPDYLCDDCNEISHAPSWIMLDAPKMVVLNRHQITEVVTKRHLSFNLTYLGIEYYRDEEHYAVMPYMDEPYVRDVKINWHTVENGHHCSICKSEVRKLGLEKQFQHLIDTDLVSYNGHNRIWEKYN